MPRPAGRAGVNLHRIMTCSTRRRTHATPRRIPGWTLRFRRLVLVAATVAGSLCHLSCSDSIENEWLRPRPPHLVDDRWREVPPEMIREVPTGVRDQAVSLLAVEPARRLSAEEAKRFVPNGAWTSADETLVLLRAVRTPTHSGSYEVLTQGGAVTIRYSALSRTTRTTKSAVVVRLAETPAEVYVETLIVR